ncbi:uncharacterized protein LOC114937355 [Nylanderia fulva]|uniref:uncharacterized protein LOC114937355 n=1 Tax=Nylanderia fulva TaxID=613905 RepID=UPI0010FB421F|nr:uncharacterized protein LOC114937355 [Nylanderia fulva]
MTGSARKASSLQAPLLVLIVACQFAFSHAGTPVVIWCPHNESSDHNSQLKIRLNPLQKLSSEEFEENLSRSGLTELTTVVVEELCVEDLRDNKVLPIVTNGSKLYYYPSVFKPNTILEKLYSDKQIRTLEDINDDHELNMVLKDTDSSECIALTGKQCRYSQPERIKRETTENNTAEFGIRTDRILFYSSKPLSFQIPEKSEKETLELSRAKVTRASSRKENDTLILTIKFAGIEDINELTLDFSFPVKSMGYYTLDKINYEITGKNGALSTKRDINFPFNFSYHCSLNTIFVNGPVSLNITDLQVQVDHKDGTFSDAYDCVGFTSIPIWTGIFVTAILALIMIWALTMIMDIRTMDRFDDPKGKTITISAAE